MRRLAAVLAAALALPACGWGKEEPEEPAPEESAAEASSKIGLRSSAFRHRGELPRRFTCDGAETSPPLSWSRVPRRARELVLLVEDNDADGFLHWTLVGISPERRRLAEGRAPREATETNNGFGRRGWGGPCPPKGNGPHRYQFSLYAVDAPLRLGEGSTPDVVRREINAHSLALGSLTGHYER